MIQMHLNMLLIYMCLRSYLPYWNTKGWSLLWSLAVEVLEKEMGSSSKCNRDDIGSGTANYDEMCGSIKYFDATVDITENFETLDHTNECILCLIFTLLFNIKFIGNKFNLSVIYISLRSFLTRTRSKQIMII